LIEQNKIVTTGKSEAKETNNKRLRLRYCTVEANYRKAQSIAWLCATAELLVNWPMRMPVTYILSANKIAFYRPRWTGNKTERNLGTLWLQTETPNLELSTTKA